MARFIDADEAIEKYAHYGIMHCYDAYDLEDILSECPTADVVEVVRCADCKYQDKGENDCEAWNLCGYRPWLHIPTEDDAFCSKGERKDG